jgi:putative SOS response-associated peptidase YedK
MPVILEDDALDRWLDPTVDDIGELQQLLAPASDDTIYAHPVSRLVNDVKNDGPEILEAPPDIQLLL